MPERSYSPELQTTMQPRRKWQEFPGDSQFFCDGRAVTAKNINVFKLTVFLIVITSALFFAFE